MSLHSRQPSRSIYTDGSYLEKTSGTWHLEDSPFKARQILNMLARHPDFQLNSVCEIGCGAGGILSELQKALPRHIMFTGYEISPQAHAMSASLMNTKCQYVLRDAFADDSICDLVLVIDVVEHVEDCFAFLRRAKQKGHFKLYHIPLDTHVRATLSGCNSWDSVGHIHLFTIETALKTLEYTGHHVVDWFLTDDSLDRHRTTFINCMTKCVRLPLAKLSDKLSARLLGGFSIWILAQ